MAGNAFWGSKTGQKQGGCCLNARTAKTNRKTTHTLKHMLKLRKFPTDWMLEKNLNGVQKPSNRALNIGKNTRAPMEGIFRGVRPSPYGGTTLNQLPIGLHVKILNFNGRFEAYWATFWMLSWYQSIQNRWKFNICFNVWVVVGIVFVVRARKQRPPCFWPDFKPQNALPPPSHHTGLLSSSKQYLIFWRF